MVRRKPEEDEVILPPPATTLQGREDQLIAATMDLVELRIANGTASAAETVHFLKQGSVQSQLQNAKLRAENEVLKTRVKEMESRTAGEGMYEAALAAFRGYSGQVPVDPDAFESDDFEDL